MDLSHSYSSLGASGSINVQVLEAASDQIHLAYCNATDLAAITTHVLTPITDAPTQLKMSASFIRWTDKLTLRLQAPAFALKAGVGLPALQQLCLTALSRISLLGTIDIIDNYTQVRSL